uniref:Ig-like domain-containing protein n=1 Tax=Anabas testudineus TaxID=64144 RepID=A0A3Q1IGY0_ANATE
MHFLNLNFKLWFQIAEIMMYWLSTQSVHQDPPDMFKDAGENVMINCNHSNSNFYMMQWYKQSTGSSEMILLGYVRYDSPAVEKPFQDLYKVSGDGRSQSSLHFQTASGTEASVVYFCAASDARCCRNPVSSTKTL